jgi:hypothetical protein
LAGAGRDEATSVGGGVRVCVTDSVGDMVCDAVPVAGSVWEGLGELEAEPEPVWV